MKTIGELIRNALAGGSPTLHEIEKQLDGEENKLPQNPDH